MKTTLTAREQQTLLIGGLLGVLVLWLYGAYIISPLMRETGKLGQDVVDARQTLQGLERATANETALREQHRQLSQAVTSLRSLLPAEKELAAVIEHLSALAAEADVKIQTITPQRSTDEPGAAPAAKGGASSKPGASTATHAFPETPMPQVYTDTLIQIDASAGFHQLGTFLSLVESSEQPMGVASLRITTDASGRKRPQIKLIIRSYFATEEGTLMSRSRRWRAQRLT